MNYDQLDPASLQLARWLDSRVRAEERQFPHLVQLKSNIRSATEAVDAASTDADRELALERQTAACFALISALPQ